MKLTAYCEDCLIRGQKKKTDDPEYLAWVQKTLDERQEEDSAPYMVYLFNQEYAVRFGSVHSFQKEKQEYNELALSMEEPLRRRIESADDPLLESILLARLGNYIDFGAMNNVDQDTFLSLFDNVSASENDLKTYSQFLSDLDQAETFCLIADNCGEIVLDRMMCDEIAKRFPHLQINVMVRGAEVLNDAMAEDALNAGFEKEQIVSNGNGASGTVKKLLSKEALDLLETADVILAKGQGNYETMSGMKRRLYYSFLCKCPLFIERFHARRLEGMFRMDEYSEQKEF
ncbi:MAG: DUF89 family protein [Solobacterium sp.]|nr:DUF89 family protein [Solobacterium sp.]